MRKMLIAAVSILASVHIASACDPVSPTSVPKNSFYDPQHFGQLGIPSVRGYVRVIDRIGCYEAQDYQTRGTLGLLFNNSTFDASKTNDPTYLAAQVIVTIHGKNKTQMLSVYRNANDKGHPERGYWANPRASRKLTDLPAGSSYNNDDFALAPEREMDSGENEAQEGSYGLFTGVTAGATPDQFATKFGEWHALLVTPNDMRGSLDIPGQSPPPAYRIVQNTWMDKDIWKLPPDELAALVGDGSIRVKQYLIHYRPYLRRGGNSPPAPNHDVRIPLQTRDASCIYVRVTGPNSYGNSFSIAQPTDQRFFAIRVNPQAVCTAPPAPLTPVGQAEAFLGNLFLPTNAYAKPPARN